MASKNKFGLVVIIIILATALFIRIKSLIDPAGPSVVVNGKNYPVLVVRTHADQIRGLGGREDLGQYFGMYFKFSEPSNYGIVMRDMLFPIDVIWLRDDRVVYFEQNLPLEPNTPEDKLTVYLNKSEAADAVLEIRAGKIKELNIKYGDRIRFCDEGGNCLK